ARSRRPARRSPIRSTHTACTSTASAAELARDAGCYPSCMAAVRAPTFAGRYAIYGEIATGGMAAVHWARLHGPVGFSRTVAVKRLHPQYAKDPEFVAGFLDEARLAARVRHPNVVSVHDVVATAGELFL